jgi:hypothetical protein
VSGPEPTAPILRSQRKVSAVEAGIVALALAIFVGFVAPTLHQPLLGEHSFRQTQTAYPARIYHEQGIDLLHPKLPVLGEPFEVPFEFPLFQAAASTVMDAGAGDDFAMRLTGLACFLLTAFLLYGLVRYVADRISAIAALVAFLASPFAVLWGRSSMIEYLATAGAVGFAWATIAWRENRRPELAGLALVAGLVGMLVKPTTAVFWIIPALAYRPSRARPELRKRTLGVLGALVLLPLAAAVVWTRHADAIKEASPTTAWLTSRELEEWNFGTLSQRLDRGVWGVIRDRVLTDVVGYGGVVLLAVALVAIVRSRQRLLWLGIALAAALPPLVFTNLYLIHDYYLAAISPALAALIGLGFGFVWRALPQRTGILAAAAVAGLAIATTTVVVGRDYWRWAYGGDPDPAKHGLARQLDALTRPTDRIAVFGLDWSPAALYYANRWGLMVVDHNKQASYRALHREGYRYALVANPVDPDNDLRPLASWRWLTVLSENVYGMSDTLGDVPPGPLLATDDTSGLSPGRLVRRGLRIRCGTPTAIPSGDRATLILPSDAKPTTRISVATGLGPLPARRAVLAAPQLASGGKLPFSCTGQTSLTLDVRDAELPSGA